MMINTVYNSIPIQFFKLYRDNVAQCVDVPVACLYKGDNKLYFGDFFWRLISGYDTVYETFQNSDFLNLLNQRYGISCDFPTVVHNNLGLIRKIADDWGFYTGTSSLTDDESIAFYNRLCDERPFIFFNMDGQKIPYSMMVSADGFVIHLFVPPRMDGFKDFTLKYKHVGTPDSPPVDLLPNYLDFMVQKMKNVDLYSNWDIESPNVVSFHSKQSSYPSTLFPLGSFMTALPTVTINRVLNENSLITQERIQQLESYAYCHFARSYHGIFNDQRHFDYLNNNKEKIREAILNA